MIIQHFVSFETAMETRTNIGNVMDRDLLQVAPLFLHQVGGR
jgi:hypothetical protein